MYSQQHKTTGSQTLMEWMLDVPMSVHVAKQNSMTLNREASKQASRFNPYMQHLFMLPFLTPSIPVFET